MFNNVVSLLGGQWNQNPVLKRLTSKPQLSGSEASSRVSSLAPGFFDSFATYFHWADGCIFLGSGVEMKSWVSAWLAMTILFVGCKSDDVPRAEPTDLSLDKAKVLLDNAAAQQSFESMTVTVGQYQSFCGLNVKQISRSIWATSYNARRMLMISASPAEAIHIAKESFLLQSFRRNAAFPSFSENP